MTTILIDADYVDRFVFELTVNFERMLERRIQKLDLSRWVDYLALDAGLRPGDEKEIQVIMLYTPQHHRLKNCLPDNLDSQLNATAIQTNIAEFCFASHPAPEDLVDLPTLYEQSLTSLLDEKPNRMLLVADLESYATPLKHIISQAPRETAITLFTPTETVGFKCQQEILTYSLMAAMNISGTELDRLK